MKDDIVEINGKLYKEIGYKNITNEVLCNLNRFLINNNFKTSNCKYLFLTYYQYYKTPIFKNQIINCFLELEQQNPSLNIGYESDYDDSKTTKITIDVSNVLSKENEEEILNYIKLEHDNFITNGKQHNEQIIKTTKIIQEYIDDICKKCDCTREELNDAYNKYKGYV